MGKIGTLEIGEFRSTSGKTISNFQITFLRNSASCGDQVSLQEYGSTGLYIVSYLPSSVGHDYLELTDNNDQTRVSFSDDIIDPTTSTGTTGTNTTSQSTSTASNTVFLTQDYGGVGALKPTIPNVQNYVLFVFYSQDWQNGIRAPLNSLNQTSLNSGGNWLSTPLVLNHGTYHLVLIDSSNNTYVLRAFLII